MTLLTQHLKVLPATFDAAYTRAQRKLIALLVALGLFVGLPTAAVSVYYGLIASDIYVSEAQFAVKRSQENVSTGLLGGLMASTGIGGGSSIDVNIVAEYLHSLDLVNLLDREVQLFAHFSSRDVDGLSRLDDDASREDFLEYYQGMMDVIPDRESGIVTIRVRAFDPEKAQQIATAVIMASEALVNRISDRISRDALSFSEQELARAEDLLRQHASQLSGLREQTQTIGPEVESQTLSAILGSLDAQLAETRAELAATRTFMRPDSPQVRALQSRIDALQGEILRQRARVSADGAGEDSLAGLIDKFEPALLDRELALERYKSALASLELTRRDALTDRLYLIPFIAPSLPDESTEPVAWQKILTTFLATLLVYAIGGLVLAAVQEHVTG